MLTITKGLKDELVQKHGLKAEASDAEANAAAIKALDTKSMLPSRMKELLKSGDPDGKGSLPNERRDTSSNPDPRQVFGNGTGGMNWDGSDVRVKHVKERFNTTKETAKWGSSTKSRTGDYEKGKDAFYWETIPGMECVQPAPGINTAQKVPIKNPSAFENAKMNALFKHKLIHDLGEAPLANIGIKMSEEDRILVKSAIHEDEWVGEMRDADGVKREAYRPVKLGEFQRKSMDDGTLWQKTIQLGQKAPVLDLSLSDPSGGYNAVPQYFDFEAIRIPLLFGELAPFVEITPTDRGRAAHSYSIGTPTFVTTVSGTAITPFDATGFVSTFDVTFYPVSLGFQWGRDFEMDAAPNFGQLVVAQMGDQFKYQIDNWIAVGDGVTQPQGLVNASGTVSVSASGSSHATMVYNDGLNLIFGVTKPYRNAFGGECMMVISTDKMYKKFMQLTTGVTGDTRPLYGMHLKDYQLGDYHFAVQNDIADGTVFAANLRGYRLYRRLGLYFELLTTGQTLTLANLKLLFARARFGGQLTLGGYCAKMTSLQIG